MAISETVFFLMTVSVGFIKFKVTLGQILSSNTSLPAFQHLSTNSKSHFVFQKFLFSKRHEYMANYDTVPMKLNAG
jgi:hypothetical protein